MQVKNARISTVGEIYFLVDDNGKLVMPVYRYMLFLRLNGKSINTNELYCKNLKLYFTWLNKKGMTCYEAIADRSKIVSNFMNFKFWLKYPNFHDQIVPITGFKAKRCVRTINQIMSTVLSFYDFLEYDEGTPELNVYREVRSNSWFGGFLNELTLSKETTSQNIFHEKAPRPKIKFLSREECKELYFLANNQRDRIIVGLLFEGGMRVSEVIGLNIVDLRDIRNNKIYITHRDDPNNPDAFVKNCSEGAIFIPNYLRDEIIDYLQNVLINIKTDYLIINLYSKVNRYKPMKRDTIEDIIERLGKKAGIEKLHPHMFRHSLAVDMMEKGIDAVLIKDKLRHKSVSTTTNIYADVNDKAKTDSMEYYSEKVDEDFTPKDTTMDEILDMLIEEDLFDE